jgi:hypothetical protein
MRQQKKDNNNFLSAFQRCHKGKQEDTECLFHVRSEEFFNIVGERFSNGLLLGGGY